LLKYIKKAFLFHWNLLGVATGAAVAFFSGYPDVVLPVLAALELIYLAGLSANPRFQDAVIAAERKNEEKIRSSSSSSAKLNQILTALNNEDRSRYERLKDLCLELRHIADRIKGTIKTELEVISDVQVNSINRLLWMYLKLLYSKNALESYFKAINVNEIEARIKRAKERLEAMGPENNDSEAEAIRRESLLDTLKTSRKRFENYRISTDNYDFIGLELERLYSKITSLAEMGINQQDPNLITNEISVVSSSIEKAERTMDELDFITGFSFQDEEPPDLLMDLKMEETSFAERSIS
jgi:hypothetical protein